MRRRRRKRGLVFLCIGFSLLLIAAGWYSANRIEDKNAGEQAQALLNEVIEKTEKKAEEEEGRTEQESAVVETEEEPVVVVNGDAFCGRIVIDKLDIALPVFQEWNYARLKEAPCRYTGGLDSEDMIIAAHNYKSHFGDLHLLQVGDEILFVDAASTEHRYLVSEITTLDGTAIEDMKAGDWDFTLFTCTKGGAQRVTVRCNKVVNTAENSRAISLG